MYEKLTEGLLEQKDLERLRNELKLLQDTNYEFGDDGLEKVLGEDIRYHVSKIIRQDLSEGNITISEYVKGILKKLEGYRSIELTVSFQPTRKNMQNISSWVKENVGEKVTVEYRYNPYLIGGAIIISQGEYRNFSLSKIVDSFFEDNKKQVKEMLSS